MLDEFHTESSIEQKPIWVGSTYEQFWAKVEKEETIKLIDENIKWMTLMNDRFGFRFFKDFAFPLNIDEIKQFLRSNKDKICFENDRVFKFFI